jgi:hypothetical protein
MIKIKLAVLVSILLLTANLGFVAAQTVTPSPTPDYTTIPTVSPSPSPSPSSSPDPTNTTDTNSTVTNSTNTVDQYNNTYVESAYVASINPTGVPLQLSAYNQTTVALIFASAVACGVNASGGHWTATQDSAGQMAFYPDELRTYSIHFQVLYDRVVDQALTLIIYSGDGQSQVLNLASNNTGFTLDIELSILDLPEIPTAEEIAQAEDSYNRDLMGDLTRAYESAMDENNFWSKTALVVAVIGIATLAVILFLNDRHRRHQDTTINNLNRHGFDGRGHA